MCPPSAPEEWKGIKEVCGQVCFSQIFFIWNASLAGADMQLLAVVSDMPLGKGKSSLY